MSGTIRSGIPSARVRALDLMSATAPRASERIDVGHSATKAAPAAWARNQVRTIRLTDFVAALAASGASVGASVFTRLNTKIPVATAVLIALAFAIVWFVALRVRRIPELQTVGHGHEFDRVVVATLAVFGLLAVVNEFVHVDGFRAYLMVGLPTGLLLLLVGRTFWQRRLNADRAVGLSLPRALIVGSVPDIHVVTEQLGRAAEPEYVIAGVVFSDGLPESDAMTSTGFPAFDGINAVADAISIANAEIVILAGPPGDGGEFIRDLSWRMESSSAELVLAWCVDSVDPFRMRFDTASGLPFTHIAIPTFSGGKFRVKRTMDVILSGFALLFLAPMFGVIALLIRLDSAGPVFFRQERVGVDGTQFSIIKFRSMVASAEADLAALTKQNEGKGVLFKLRADPRVTRVGAILRRYSLDELPQLWNIFVGQMSIVGPRPPLAREVRQYDDRVQRRLYIKPGLTGAWQVGGRSDLSWEESIRLDLHYVENWTILGDLRIMWRTVSVVVRHVGAY